MLVKSERNFDLSRYMRSWLAAAPKREGNLRLDVDIDPKNPNRILVTHDGGMYMTTDHGRTSTRVTLPIGQIYHVAVDNDVPYKIYGNMQDDGTMRGANDVV